MSGEKTAIEFVKYVLEQMCEDRSAIVVESSTDDLGILLTITVAEPDMGKLIGKEGQTISALRTLVRVIGARSQERINVKVLEPSN